ncbi:MAG: DUF3833 domain-containing protein [Pseudomonadota bacterium]
MSVFKFLQKRFYAVAIGVLALSVTACASQNVADRRGETPTFVLEDYFQGEMTAYGVFDGRRGHLKRKFKVDLKGSWDGETLTLEEDFFYDDGETDRRVWKFTKTGPNSYVGRAGDVVGEARIEAAGDAVNLKYLVDLKLSDGSVRVRFDDWLYLLEDGVAINRAFVRKFGFRVGEVSLVFVKD